MMFIYAFLKYYAYKIKSRAYKIKKRAHNFYTCCNKIIRMRCFQRRVKPLHRNIMKINLINQSERVKVFIYLFVEEVFYIWLGLQIHTYLLWLTQPCV